MTERHPLVLLVDVDNTLLDNDHFRDDLLAHLTAEYGEELASRYWSIQERRFVELGYRDYVGAVQEWWEGQEREQRLLGLTGFLLGYPFAERLYPHALDVLAHLRTLGTTVVLTDGDAVYQPHKIERAGIARAVDGMLVYVHKELSLADVEARYRAERYVLVDDKLRILTAAKEVWGERVTTVLPLQGQFATDPAIAAAHPAADITVDSLAGLLEREL